MKWNWIFVGSIAGALAVVCGAFAAHGLKDRLAPEELEWWKTAVLYHALHSPAIVLCGLLDRASPAQGSARGAPSAFFLGIAIFSGSLYAMALGGPRGILGPITPIGGVLLIVGWTLLALRGLKR